MSCFLCSDAEAKLLKGVFLILTEGYLCFQSCPVTGLMPLFILVTDGPWVLSEFLCPILGSAL